MLDFKGDYGSDVRPARQGAGRKAWAKDPTDPLANNGTRLDATAVNDLKGMLVALFTAAGIPVTPGDDAALAAAVTALAAAAMPASTDDLAEGAINLYFTNGRADARIAAAIGATVQAYLGYTPVNKAGDTMTGALTLAGDGANPLHAVTKQQLDAALYGLDGKESVRAASTASVDIAAAPASIDGVTLAAGDRVLLKNQTAPAENGIRVFTAAGAALARAADMDAWSEVPGAFVAVEEGTANADTTWLCTANKGGTLDTSSISFTQANSPSSGVSSFNGRNGAVLPADDDYAVTQLAAIAANSFVGNNGGAPARPVIMTAAQAKTLLNYVFADIGSTPTTLAGYGITDPVGKVIDRAYAEYTAWAALTATIPADDTIPQNTEGTEILTASITPKSAANRVRVRVVGFGGVGQSADTTIALFKDSGVDAIAARCVTTSTGNHKYAHALEFEHVPGTTSPVTYKVRVGPGAGTLGLNGAANSRLYGGVAQYTMVVEEITP